MNFLFLYFLSCVLMLAFIFQALKSVEEVVLRLENFLQELYASSASSGKEHLKAAYFVLEKIRKLKKEAEFLEASFRAKADSLQEVCLHLFRPLYHLLGNDHYGQMLLWSLWLSQPSNLEFNVFCLFPWIGFKNLLNLTCMLE